jgi:hypothetical protein
VRVNGRIREDIPNRSFGEFSRALILFLYNPYMRSQLNVCSVSSVHPRML